METIGPSALVIGILYFLGRWELASLRHAVEHPGNGRPRVTWRMAWWLAILVSLLSACSVHVALLAGGWPKTGTLVFNAIVFGGFLVGFVVSGQLDHKARLGLRS
jgi:membrane protein YdbS with pleckstrin-like domain